jgi:TMEM175 potassium channel family protein
MNAHRSKSRHEADVELNHQDQFGLERLIFFSDAVFAIAITLLVLEIRLPVTNEKLTDAQLLNQLLGIWHKYLSFLISFLVIGTFWIGHHRKFRFIKGYDSTLILLNLLMLMLIAFIPFPTSIIGEYSNRTATIFYAITMTIASLFSWAIWWHASRNGHHIDSSITAKQRQRQMLLPFATSTIFLLSVGIGFINADLAKFSWLLILFASLYANKN